MQAVIEILEHTVWMQPMNTKMSTQHIGATAGRTFFLTIIAIAAVLLACSSIALFVPPAIGWDAAAGFRVWNSMTRGAPLNHVREVSPTDISRDTDRFFAWFSPGQYVLPGLLMWTGMSMNRSIWVLTVVLTPLALVGYYYLYTQAFHFTRTISIVSCLVIALSRQTFHSYVEYNGGALLQFAAFPVFLLAALICIRRSGAYIALIFFLFLAGAFLKLSFSLIALSLVASVILDHLPRRGFEVSCSRIVRPLAALLTFLAFSVTLRVFYLAQGPSPVDRKIIKTFGQFLFAMFYSIAAVTSGIMSLFSALANLGSPLHFIMFPDPIPRGWVPAFVVLTLISAVLIYWTYRRSVNSTYRALLVGFAGIHICAIAFLAGNGMSALEERHLWPASAVLLPGLVSAIARSKSRTGKVAAIVIAAVFMGYAGASYFANVRRSMHSGRSVSLGVTLPGRSQRLIDTIEGLDLRLNSGRTVFYISDPGLSILVRRHPLVLEGEGGDIFTGKTDRVIIIEDRKSEQNRRATSLTSRFKSYDKWQRTTIDSTDIYYSSKDAVPLLER